MIDDYFEDFFVLSRPSGGEYEIYVYQRVWHSPPEGPIQYYSTSV